MKKLEGRTFVRLSTYIFSLLMMVCVLYCLLGLGMLRYVDQSYENIPRASQRSDVRERLKYFRETESTLYEIPVEFRPNIDFEDVYSVFKYTFLLNYFSFYIIYNTQNKMIMKIPTYE